MLFEIEVRNVGDESGWTERIVSAEVTTQEQADKYGKDAVVRFNNSLRFGEEPREFVSATLIGEIVAPPPPAPIKRLRVELGEEYEDSVDLIIIGSDGHRFDLVVGILETGEVCIVEVTGATFLPRGKGEVILQAQEI